MNLARPEELEPHLARIAGAWQEIVGDVDHGAMEIFGRVEALARELAALQRDILTKFGLNYAEFTTLGILRTSFPEFQGSPTELRRLVGQSSAGMTRILAKLEGERLVRRDAHAEDGRRVHVALTARGVALAGAVLRRDDGGTVPPPRLSRQAATQRDRGCARRLAGGVRGARQVTVTSAR